MDLAVLILIVVGGTIVLFLLTYLALHRKEGIFYEICSQRKHPYRFTLYGAVGHSAGFILVYLIQRYVTPYPFDAVGIVLFALILLTSFTTVVFDVEYGDYHRIARRPKLPPTILY